MTKSEFIKDYVVNFLSSFAALNDSLLEEKDLYPIDAAVERATVAWEKLEYYKK